MNINNTLIILFTLLVLLIVSCTNGTQTKVLKQDEFAKDTLLHNIEEPFAEHSTNEAEFETILDTIKPIKLSENEEKFNAATMRMGHVTSLRKAIDMFNRQQSSNEFVVAEAAYSSQNEQSNDPELKPTSFQEIHKDGYLAGKFIVFGLEKNPDGGVNITIMFQHRQDKMFNVWMDYLNDKDFFIVRRISIITSYGEKELKLHRRVYSLYLNDEGYGV